MPKGYPNTPDGRERKRLATIAMNKRPDIVEKRRESNRRRCARGEDPLRRPEVVRRAAEARIGGKRSAATKAKMSAARVRIMRRNGFISMYRLAQAKQRGSCRYCRSSWEAQISELLAVDPRVDWWSYEAVTVAYDDGETIRNTVPDFLVKLRDGRRVIVESKASWSIPKELRKLVETRDFARRLGMTFAVITEYDLAQDDPLAEVMSCAPWFPTQGVDTRLLI